MPSESTKFGLTTTEDHPELAQRQDTSRERNCAIGPTNRLQIKQKQKTSVSDSRPRGSQEATNSTATVIPSLPPLSLREVVDAPLISGLAKCLNGAFATDDGAWATELTVFYHRVWSK